MGGENSLYALVGGRLFSLFPEFFIDPFIEPFSLGFIELNQFLLESLHFLAFHFYMKRLKTGAPVFEVFGSAFLRHYLTSLLRATYYHVARNKSSPFCKNYYFIFICSPLPQNWKNPY